MLAVFVSIVSLFSVVAGLKYELAIPLPEDERDAIALTILSLILIFTVAVISAIGLFWWGGPLTEAMDAPELAGYLWLLPIAVLFTGMYNLFTHWSIRLKDFPVIARTKIGQQVVTLATQVSLFKLGGLGLLVGKTTGSAVAVVTLAKKVFDRESWGRQPVKRVGYVLKRYSNFPIFSTWGAFLNTAGAQLPPLLFASMFGATYAGFYALAHRLIALPMGSVGQAVGQVILSDSPAQYRSGNLPDTLNKAHKILIKCITPPTAILILFGPTLFAVVFGEEWKVSGEIASWLALWMLMAFTTSPLSSVFAVTEKQYLGMIMQAVLLISRVSGIGLGIFYDDFMLAVIFFSIFNVVGYLIYQVISFQALGISMRVPMSNYASVFLMVGVLMGINSVFDVGSSGLAFAGSLVLSAIYYFHIIRNFRHV